MKFVINHIWIKKYKEFYLNLIKDNLKNYFLLKRITFQNIVLKSYSLIIKVVQIFWKTLLNYFFIYFLIGANINLISPKLATVYFKTRGKLFLMYISIVGQREVHLVNKTK